MKMAYCTLLSSEDYLDAVLVLNQSLRAVKSQYPLFVMITKPVASNQKLLMILNSASIFYKIIEPLQYSIESLIKHSGESVLNTASKLQIFNIREYDKLIYIDADTLVLKNIDHIFNYPDGAMIKYSDDEDGFSGLFVVEPDFHLHDEIEYYLLLIQTTQAFDGDLLGNLWFCVRSNINYQIPENYLACYHKSLRDYDNNIYVIHYCNQIKPWLQCDHEIFQTDALGNDLYRKYLSQVDKIKNF